MLKYTQLSCVFLQFAQLPLDGAERLLFRQEPLASPAGRGCAGSGQGDARWWWCSASVFRNHHYNGSLSRLPKSHRASFASSCANSWLPIRLLSKPFCFAQGKSGTRPAANSKGLVWSIWLFWTGQVASQNARAWIWLPQRSQEKQFS